MAGHAPESYFILGEGLLSQGVEFGDVGAGEDAATGALRAADAEAHSTGHGARSAQAAAATARFHFSRMGPRGPQLADEVARRVGRAMTAGSGRPASQVPAGYTYLGQFIDHDLTFDKTPVTFGENVSAGELRQGRSPALDLDSLYGAGPNDPRSARFYRSDGLRLRLGRTVAAGDPAMDGFDLPRGAGDTPREKRRAVIPDRRNDENLAVAQTHLAMMRFHNRVVATLGSVPAPQRFKRAREQVVKHYQWMIRHDYLPRICDPDVVDDVFANGRRAFEAGAVPTDTPTMPIEFSVAAFRMGHSMIRGAYDWNRNFPDGAGTLELLFEFSGTSGPLGGRRRLSSNWIADFRRLYDFGDAGRPDLKVPESRFNRAMRIDTRLVDPLRSLPHGSFGAKRPPKDPALANLAFRNLIRAKMVKLATGQKMAEFLHDRGVAVTPLTKAQIRQGDRGASLDGLTATQRAAFLDKTPLWFYVLREAELDGGRLAGVGARIVAETFHRAMEGSRFSIVRDTAFTPTLGTTAGRFNMADLLLFAFEGREDLLNPLGD